METEIVNPQNEALGASSAATSHNSKLVIYNNTPSVLNRVLVVRSYNDFVSYIFVENLGPYQTSKATEFKFETGKGTPSDLWTCAIRIEGVGGFSVASGKCNLTTGDSSVKAEINNKGNFKYELKIIPSNSSSREWKMPLIPW